MIELVPLDDRRLHGVPPLGRGPRTLGLDQLHLGVLDRVHRADHLPLHVHGGSGRGVVQEQVGGEGGDERHRGE